MQNCEQTLIIHHCKYCSPLKQNMTVIDWIDLYLDFKIKFWSGDDSPVIRPLHRPVEVYFLICYHIIIIILTSLRKELLHP